MTPLRIFIGYDSREPVAYHVLAHSILRRASVPVSVTPLVQPQLRSMGIYTRDRGPTESTEFSLTRFLIPYLCGFEGYAVFMDCDMLCLADVAQLWTEMFRVEHEDARWTAAVCQHDYSPGSSAKFLSQPQTVYPRKNWSSFTIFNNARCTNLMPAYVNQADGRELHRFAWTWERDQIACLPLEWNWLVGEYPTNPNAKILHYTLGGPWFDGHCDHRSEWIDEWRSMKEPIGNGHSIA